MELCESCITGKEFKKKGRENNENDLQFTLKSLENTGESVESRDKAFELGVQILRVVEIDEGRQKNCKKSPEA